jgi:ABC-type sulfate transport system permease subunit
LGKNWVRCQPFIRQKVRDTQEPKWVKWTLLTLALGLFHLIFGYAVSITVFTEALRKGWDVYLAALHEARCAVGYLA